MTKRFSTTVRAAALLGALGLSACAPALGPFPQSVAVGGAVGGPVAVGGGGWGSSPGAVAWGGAPVGWRRHDPFWGPRSYWGPGWHRGPGWGHAGPGWHGRHWSHGPGGWHGRKGFGGAGFGWRW